MSVRSNNSSLIAFSTVALFVGITLLLITCGGGGSSDDSQSPDSSSSDSEETSSEAGVENGKIVEGEWSGYFYFER